MSRLRAFSLVSVHVLIIGHVVHWLISGRTLSPVEPSEAMYALNHGHINAGLIFFGASLGATLLLGRFVCGWGCHVIAYQDLCRWLLKKIGIRPKAFRSRILALAPLALALYMFVWPTVYRWCAGIPRPQLSNHIMKTDFWETFPGPVVAVLTLFVCGFMTVYFLGSKGFCTYGCPYGGFFGLADKLAPGRILVTDACQHCGHCTAACTSNVRVHEEVALYGMVVDPGCMKCMDCVSVCPNDALHFGFAKPSIVAKARSKRRPVHYDFSLWEEGVMVVVGLVSLLAFRGLYGQIPLLLAMGIAGLIAYIFAKFIRVVRTANVRLQNRQLKRGGRLTRAGLVFTGVAGMLFIITGHSAAVRYHVWHGQRLFRAAEIGDEVWLAGGAWWAKATPEARTRVSTAGTMLEWSDRWGLMATPAALSDLVWLYLARDRDAEAKVTLRRIIDLTPDRPSAYRGLASVLLKNGRVGEAERMYGEALGVDPDYAPARNDLAALHYDISMSLIDQKKLQPAIRRLQQSTELRPEIALYRYNLAVATFMAGRPAEALPHIQEAIRLDPGDPDARGFLSVVLRELGDAENTED